MGLIFEKVDDKIVKSQSAHQVPASTVYEAQTGQGTWDTQKHAVQHG